LTSERSPRTAISRFAAYLKTLDPGSTDPGEPVQPAPRKVWKVQQRDIFASSGIDELSRTSIPIDDYERWTALRWLTEITLTELRRLDHPTSVIRIARFFCNYAASMGLPRDLAERYLALTPAAMDDDPEARELLTELVADTVSVPQPEPSALARRIDWFCSFFGAGPEETMLAALSLRSSWTLQFGQALDRINRSTPIRILHGSAIADFHAASSVLGIPARILRDKAVNGSLWSAGILGPVQNDEDGQSFTFSAVARKVLFSDASTIEDIMAMVLPEAAPSVLEDDDFSHLGTGPSDVARIVEAAAAHKEKGVGIVLSGPVGTGKTEFARYVASRSGLRGVFIGETGKDGAEPGREERLAHLLFTSALSAHYGPLLLIVDEAEDIFLGVDSAFTPSRRGSKVFLNGRLEKLEMPVLWITNQPPQVFGASILRRMTYHLDFTITGDAVRRRITERVASRNDTVLTPQQLDDIVGMRPSPAVVDTGFRTARLLGGDMDSALTAMRSIEETISGPAKKRRPTGPYDTSLANTDVDLVALEEEIVSSGRLDFSLMISGISGTGKSAFARHLAERLGLETTVAKASDVFGPYVGETEQKIAAMFRNAARSKSFLILDEADSFFQDRRMAERNWEVTQVNELLTWMEDHPYPFVATTNLVARFDPATRRRFDFKLGFGPMLKPQIESGFLRFFGFRPGREILALDNMTPGDLAVVKRQAKLRGITDQSAISAMLVEEVSGKEGSRNPIGF
jgi:transitional endoplasmic reticulum ATPase